MKNGTVFTIISVITELVHVQSERIIAILSHLANYDYSQVVQSLEDLPVPHAGHTPENIYYERLLKELVNQYLEENPIPPGDIENLERDFPTTFVSYSEKTLAYNRVTGATNSHYLAFIAAYIVEIAFPWQSTFQLRTKSFQKKLLD